MSQAYIVPHMPTKRIPVSILRKSILGRHRPDVDLRRMLAGMAILLSISRFNSFTPEFLKWTFASLNSNTSIVANRGFSQIQ